MNDDAAGVAHYFEAWNRNDPEAVAALFAHGGTYYDTATHYRQLGLS